MLLFDDVKTSGGSFVQNANKLMALGAAKVTEVFLGETSDSYANGEPSWEERPIFNPSHAFQNEPPDDLPF